MQPSRHRLRRPTIAAVAIGLVAVLSLGAPATAGARATTTDRAATTDRRAAVACPSTGTANGAYVRFVYLEILDRCPDAGGLAHWTGRLAAGQSRWSVAEAIDTSTENLVGNNVDPLFTDLVGRAPTSAERTRWVGHIRRAHEDAVPTATLLASDEGYALKTSAATVAERDQEWVDAAYDRILDRAPDPAGRAYYLRRFGPSGSTAASRYAMAIELERSTSNARSWVRAAMAEALGRPGDPAGVESWTRWLTGSGRWQTFRLWTHQLSSDEAFHRAQALDAAAPS